MQYQSAEERGARLQALVTSLLSISKNNFDSFDDYRTWYYSEGHQIGVNVLVPKTKPSHDPRPVIVRIHGGFLITGSSLFPAWFSKWILDFAEAQSAVIVSPDYRLLPESKGIDILNDMKAFWEWYADDGPAKELERAGRDDVTLDKSRLLLLGESAGGYLAVQSVLSAFTQPRAMVTLYPMLDMKADHYTKEYPKSIVAVPNFPHETVDNALKTLPASDPITRADPSARLDLALTCVHTGRFLEFLGKESELFVLERLLKKTYMHSSSGESIFPPIFILHGEQDSAVPVDGTRRFLKILKAIDPKARIYVAFRSGDHGFDFDATLQDEWLREGLEWVASNWLCVKPVVPAIL